jgi:hypothetical protein
VEVFVPDRGRQTRVDDEQRGVSVVEVPVPDRPGQTVNREGGVGGGICTRQGETDQGGR